MTTTPPPTPPLPAPSSPALRTPGDTPPRANSAQAAAAASLLSPDSAIMLDPPGLADPPPPYPSDRRRRRRRTNADAPSGPASAAAQTHAQGHAHAPFPTEDSAGASGEGEGTPLLASPRSAAARPRRPRTLSAASTAGSSVGSVAPSLARTMVSLFYSDDEEDDEGELVRGDMERAGERAPLLGPSLSAGSAREEGVLSAPREATGALRRWRRYFRPLGRRVYYASLFHLMVLNFPFALLSWVYLFVFTVTGTTLLITLPLGAVLCFFDLLGARALARGELALQRRFHGPLACDPYPPRPIFTRLRESSAPDAETAAADAAAPAPTYEPSFYRNSYSMFTDSTSYRALFYFLVIKAAITLLLSVALVVVVPVSVALVLPAPAMLRAVRKVGIWQANVAVEGLYMSVL